MEQTPSDSFAFESPLNARRVLAIFGLLCAIVAVVVPLQPVQLGLAAVAATLLCISFGLWLRGRPKAPEHNLLFEKAIALVAEDSAPRFVTRTDGQLIAQNPAAEGAFSDPGARTLASLLKPHLAHPGSVLYRLQSRAFADGSADEDLATAQGHMRIAVQRLDAHGFLWRIETLPTRDLPRPAIEGQALPMIMIGRNETVLFMNDAARSLIGRRVKTLDRIFQTLPVMPGQIAQIETETGRENMLIAEVASGAGRRALYLLPEPAGPQTASTWQTADELPVPMLKLAPDGTVLFFNSSAENLLGAGLK